MTQRNLFPILLVGLPIGLGLSVVAALYLYYNPLDIPLPSRPTRQDAAVFLRRSPNESDLRDYHRILVTDLASRTRHAPDQQRTAANWIASTLGPSNLGLPVRLVESELPGTADAPPVRSASLVVELTGTRQKNEAIVIVTGYETDTPGMNSALSTASLMTVVSSFIATPQRRTLVFAFQSSETPAVQGGPPLDALIQSLKLRDLSIKGILDLRVSASASLASPDLPTPKAMLEICAPREGQSWTGEVREAFAPRKPAGVPVDFPAAADAPPDASALAGWSAAPAPYLLLWVRPKAPNDEATPLAVARSLEGVLQALANQ